MATTQPRNQAPWLAGTAQEVTEAQCPQLVAGSWVCVSDVQSIGSPLLTSLWWCSLLSSCEGK